MKKKLVLLICVLIGICSMSLFAEDLVIDRSEYKERLRGFWLGSCIANWTGLQTEGHRTWIPYYTDNDLWRFPFVLDQDPWGSDDDTDIEYIFQHAMDTYKTSKLTGEQIRDQWLEHISPYENNFLWVSNESAFHLMRNNGMIPPDTSAPAFNPNWEMIDAQLTTEIFGYYAPGHVPAALDISYLPIRTTAYSHARYAAQFYVIMYSLAAKVDKNLSYEEQVLWLADQARRYMPESTYIAGMYDWVRNEYVNAADKNNWEAVRDAFHYRYIEGGADGYVYREWFDAGSNFGLSIISLLFGQGDFKRTVEIGIVAGMDSDNPTATWGGLLGFLYSIRGLEEHFGKYDFSDRYRIGRTRINFRDVDTLTDLAEVGLSITDRVVVEQMGGYISGNKWVIPEAADNNIASEGTIIAAVMYPEGGGNHDPEVIRDGIKPAPGNRSSTMQYDTYNGEAGPVEEYMGYTFDETRTFRKVVFTEGMHFTNGGWFANGSLRVQVRKNGSWIDEAVTAVPSYPVGNSQETFGSSYETYTFTLDDAVGDGIRLIGTTGGDAAAFISVAELEVYENDEIDQRVSLSILSPDGEVRGAGFYQPGESASIDYLGEKFKQWSGDTETVEDVENPSTTVILNNTTFLTVKKTGPPPFTVPGKIEAEAFFNSSDPIGFGIEPCSEGGENIGWIDKGDWWEYQVDVTEADTYLVEYRTACWQNTAALRLSIDGEIQPVVGINRTGGFQEWGTASQVVTLSAGEKTLRIEAMESGWNFDFFELKPYEESDIIGLKSMANGKYVCADNYGNAPLIANRDAVGGWEEFTLAANEDGTVSLKASANGLYVSVENGLLIANSSAIGAGQKFIMEKSGSIVSLKSAANGKYVCADNYGNNPLIANRETASGWEQFEIVFR